LPIVSSASSPFIKVSVFRPVSIRLFFEPTFNRAEFLRAGLTGRRFRRSSSGKSILPGPKPDSADERDFVDSV
jgi:hypothetical protein